MREQIGALAVGVVLVFAWGGCKSSGTCADELCEEPPAAYCLDGDTLFVYDATGSCVSG